MHKAFSILISLTDLRTAHFRLLNLLFVALLIPASFVTSAHAQTTDDDAPQLNQNCTASLQNHTVQVNPDGTFAIPNVPVDQGLYRVRIVCRQPDGTTTEAHSEFVSLVANGETQIRRIRVGTAPSPASLRIITNDGITTLSTRGETLQLGAIGTLSDGSIRDYTFLFDDTGTTYSSSNPAVATVDGEGLITAVSRGTVVITVRADGVAATRMFTINIPNDADSDGMPDEYERLYGLNLNDAADAALDADGDGLTNLQEFTRGTNPRAADTDGDGLNDSAEVARGTNPLRADTDGDGLNDGREVTLGTNPLNRDTDADGIDDALEIRIGSNPLTPDATTTVQGRVVNNNDAPVANASAIIFNFLSATTRDDGTFTIERVPVTNGNITVVAQLVSRGQLFAGMSQPTAPAANGNTDVGMIKLELDSGTVSGIVTDVQSRPVANVEVTLTAGPGVRVGRTDTNGRYRFGGVSSGDVAVLVRDPATGLRGRSQGQLAPNLSLTLDVSLAPSATIRGTVFGRDATTPVGSGVIVSLPGRSLLTRTDELGNYVFEFLPLGNYVVEASDSTGNRGRSQVDLTATGQTAVADIAYLGKGTVTGTVRNPANAPVAGATVKLNGRGIFGGTFTVTTDAGGLYTIADVFIGAYDVTAVLNRLGGRAEGEIQVDGQSATTDITLVASGDITGTIFRRDGTTPVPGVAIRLSPTGLTATTNEQGAYSFNALPLDTYTITARDVATGDQGRGTATIAAQDQTVNVNINLNGLSRVIVTVRDGANNTVAGARVTLNSDANNFTATQAGTTGADGTAVFERVLIGGVTASATDFATRLSGTTSGTVASNTDTNLTVQLQATGTVTGTVRAPNGATVGGIFRVRLRGQIFKETTNSATGAFRFEMVPTNTYIVEVVDNLGNVRARANNVTVTRQDEVVDITLDLIGVGTVSGIVTNPDGTPASGTPVFLDVSVGDFRRFTTTTDISGAYSFMNVPVGSFTAAVNILSGTLSGSATGIVTENGGTTNVNIALTLFTQSRNLFDLNNFRFDLQRDLSIGGSTNNFFLTGNPNASNGALLDIIANGTPFRFNPNANSTLDATGRQLTASQSLAGLDVTRRVFVPTTGYFARYMETLSNPTSEPITVDVRVTSNSRFINKVQNGTTFAREPRVVLSSSGDTTLDVTNPSARDRWVVIDDDEDLDPFIVTNNLPGVAHVFDGANATQNSGSAIFSIDFTNRFGQLTHQWQSVTLAPGQSATFLHFIAQQTDRAAAQASAERLVQLPPEALTGLTTQDAADIRNFAVQLDANNVPPLPALDGRVNGFVTAADGSTIIPNARVTFQSSNPIFHRVYTTTANSAGMFTFASRFANGDALAVPVDAFMLQATHPQSGVVAIANGSFSDSETQSATNVTFGNSGTIVGVVRRATGVVVSSGVVRISGSTLNNTLQVSIGADGSYRATGLPAGNYNVSASTSGLSGTTTTAVNVGETSTADITIEPTGIVTGIVRRANNIIVVGATVNLRFGETVRRATTDTSGRYTFIDVPTVAATLDIFDSASNTAARAAVTITSDATITRNLTLIPGGIVRGLITGANNEPVANAQVTLTTVGGTLTTTTGSDGRYEIGGVLQGNVVVQVTNPATGFRGRVEGGIGQSGSTLTLDIRLSASGTVTGIIFRADGTTPAVGIAVTLTNTSVFPRFTMQSTTDANGRYTFDGVLVGNFTVEASEPSSGDRGRASNQLTANGETRTVNFNLIGVGRIVVTVRDANNVVVSGVQVTLSGNTQLGGSQTATSGADGTAIFERALAGSFSVSAINPINNLRGSANGTLAPSGTATITVQLQPTGMVAGRVFAADGTTPVSGARLRLTNLSVTQQVTSASDGTYRFEIVPLGGYNLEAFDGNNRLRQRVIIAVSANGEMVIRDLSFIGLGTVTGRVSNPDGTAASNISVTVNSPNTVIGSSFNAQTNAQGDYTVANVPVGSFTVTARNSNGQLQGEATGQIAADGETVTANVQLVTNSINLPFRLYDANRSIFDVQPDASIGDASTVNGGDSYFANTSNFGGFQLDIVANGSANPFTGVSVGTTEESRREIVVGQQNLAGLNVTRKAFVPRDGYFVRYLETLTNPTANPITVDVRVTSNIRNLSGTNIVTTSSGDAALNIDGTANQDRWVVIDDATDTDPLTNLSLPGLGFIFDGQGATERTDAGEYVAAHPRRLSYSWNAVRLEPNQSVTFMHFGVQQTTRAAAQSSAERLVQLPPEAIADLTDTEITQIRNFVVPANRTSPLAPFNLNGTVTGRVLESDVTRGAPGGSVSFKSNNPIFSRTYTLTTAVDSSFTFTTTIDQFGGRIIVPVEDFTLTAIHPQSRVVSPIVAGSFAAGETATIRDIVFSNTGSITGTVRRHTGAVVTGGSVSIFGSGFTSFTVNIESNGSFRLGGLPAGNNYSITASIPRPQGTALSIGVAIPSVVAGQTLTVDVTLPATGTVTGIVTNADGSLAVNANVRLDTTSSTSTRSSSATTDTAGRYTITDVEEGSYQVSAFDRITFVRSTSGLTVVRDATTTQNLTLIGYGQVNVQVNLADGTPAVGSSVTYRPQANNSNLFGGETDAMGRLTIPNVPVGDFTVTAFHPTISNLTAQAASRLNANGDTVAVTITLPGAGTVTGRVTRPDNTPSANTFVELFGIGVSSQSTSTDSNGNYTFTRVPANRPFTLRASDNSNGRREITGNVVPSDGATLTVNLTLPARASVRVTVRNPDGTPYPDAAIYITDPNPIGVSSRRRGAGNVGTAGSSGSSFRFVGNTDASGVLLIEDVYEGAFTIEARNPETDFVLGTINGTVANTDHNRTIDVVITTSGLRRGIVEGRIVAADNQTPVPFAYIEIFDVSDGQRLNEMFSNENGEYRFTDVAPSTNDGFRVVAHEVNDFSISVESSASFPTDGATVSINFTLPTSVIKGFVYFADGTTPVERLTVSATQTTDGNTRNFFAFKTGSDGSYTLTGVPVGDFTLTAQDNDTGLNGTARGTLADIAVPLTLNVTLPVGGIVTGRVLDYSGSPVPNNGVSLRPDNLPSSERTTITDATGVYRFERVPVGGFTVFSQLNEINGSASSRVVNSGDTVTLDITFPPRGTINGQVFAPDGTTPVAGAPLRIRNSGNIGVGGRTFLITATADSEGRYSVGNVPVGNIRVAASDPNTSLGGTAFGTLTADEPLTLNITLGTDFVFESLNYNLDGGDNFRYDVTADGTLEDGGTPKGDFNDAYDGAYRLVLDRNATFGEVDAGRIELNNRQIVLESNLANLAVKRKIFSPVAGKFARYLEVLTNNSNASRTVNVDIQSNLGSDSSTRIVVSPDETDFRFAVTDQNGQCCDPALGHVFNGFNARTSISGLSFNNGNDFISYSWNVTIPAGQTVTLMHFAVQRAPEDTDGARSQSEALSDLSDADMLEGMSDEEKSQVVNFNLVPASITQPRASPSTVKRPLRPSRR